MGGELPAREVVKGTEDDPMVITRALEVIEY
jgi:hypothetical protein